MILDGNSKVGSAKVYATKKEMNLEKELQKYKQAYEILKEANEHYANRMGSGGAAREAAKKAEEVLGE